MSRLVDGTSSASIALFLQEVQADGQREDLKDARGAIQQSKKTADASRKRIEVKERDVEADQEELKEHQERGPGWLEKHFKIGNHGGKTKELQGSINAHSAEIEHEEALVKRENGEIKDELTRIKDGFDVVKSTVQQLESMLDASNEMVNRVVRG